MLDAESPGWDEMIKSGCKVLDGPSTAVLVVSISWTVPVVELTFSVVDVVESVAPDDDKVVVSSPGSVNGGGTADPHS